MEIVNEIRNYVAKLSEIGETEKQDLIRIKDEIFTDLLALLHSIRNQTPKLGLPFLHEFFKWLVVSIPVYLALWVSLKLWWPGAFQYVYPALRNIVAIFGTYVVVTTISSSLVIDLDRAKRLIDNLGGNKIGQTQEHSEEIGTETWRSKIRMFLGLLLFFFLCPYFLLSFLEKELGSRGFNEADFVFKYKNEKGNGPLPCDFQEFINNIFSRVRSGEIEIQPVYDLKRMVTEHEELIQNIDEMFDFPVPTSIDEVRNMYVLARL